MASPTGIEPVAPSLGNLCSILLSYGDVIDGSLGVTIPDLIPLAKIGARVVGPEGPDFLYLPYF